MVQNFHVEIGMNALNDEPAALVEEEIISELLNISCNHRKPLIEQLGCANCGKRRSYQQDLKRWSDGSAEGSLSAVWNYSCDCKHEAESQGRNEGLRLKKKYSMDTVKGGRNQSTSVKDFIAHNKLLCNVTRHKISDEKMYQFVHHTNNRSYIERYRRNKLKKLEEQSSFQQDQSNFDTELFNSLSKSLSNLITDGINEKQPSVNQADAIGQHIQSRLKLDKKCQSPYSSCLGEANLVSKSKNKNLTALDLCMKCGDTVKSRQLAQSVYQETNFLTRAGSLDKAEEKRQKKFSKRISDQRPKLLSEKNLSDLTRPIVISANSSNLQPVCHQIPIRNTTITDKQTSPKKADCRGHSSPTKSTYSDTPGKGADGRRKQNGVVNSVGKSLEYPDVFNTYGEKYRLVKESI